MVGVFGNVVEAPKDFLLEVANGNIPGSNVFVLRGSSKTVSTVEEQVHALPADITLATSNQSLEIVSDDPDDTSGGTGARTISISTLDITGVISTQTVTMNGTTAVNLTGSNHFRVRSITALTAGSTESNEGLITLRIQGGGDNFGAIAINDGQMRQAIYTVPINKKSHIVEVVSSCPKGEDVTFFLHTKVTGGALLRQGELNLYHNPFSSTLKLTDTLPALTDILIIASSTNLTPIIVDLRLGILETTV